MNWRFTLLDRDNISTIVKEPVGFDAIVINLSRDLDKHGVVTDYQENDFEFSGAAFQLIKNEYDTYGVEGNMTIIIEQTCNSIFEEMYRGKLVFADNPVFVCGASCSVKIPISTTSDVINLINKWDQKVNLLTDKAFDETTVLPAYSKLGYDLLLPSKGILFQNKAENDTAITVPILGAVNDCGVTSEIGGIAVSEDGFIDIPFSKIAVAEIGGFSFPGATDSVYTSIGGTCIPFPDTADTVAVVPHPQNIVWPDASAPVVNYAEGFSGFGQISSITPVELAFKLKGSINFTGATADSIQLVFYRRTKSNTYEWIWDKLINDYHDATAAPHVFSYDETFTDTLYINEGDRFYLNLLIGNSKSLSQASSGENAYTLTFDATNYFRMKALSHTPPTPTKAFMVNEALSRIAEAITNNKIKAYSEYFGRTDSEPYASTVDGCAGLESITKGLFIRRQENRNGNSYAISLSMQDMWEGLEPIHHIGFGIEADTNRDGFQRLRVETWKHFYNNTVVLTCNNVAAIQRTVVEKEHFSTFRFGYEKWEAEEYNGLDEFLTKRGYRTTLSQVKNELSKLSKFISSGYAWEITRRKGDIDSKDWRYDNDTFIVCNKRTNTLSFIVSYSDNTLGFWLVHTIPSWAVVGSAIDIEAMETDEAGNAAIPGNTGTYTIVSAALVGGYLSIVVTPSFTTFRLVAGAKITSTNINSIDVELGNVTSPENIIDAPTIYNYRISPIRNAMRWIDKIFAGYRTIAAGNKILFMDGEGNYFAKGEMSSDYCKVEAAAIAENESIDNSKFEDPSNADPFLRPERVVYQYPMSLHDFKLLKANPYGLIAFNNNCEEGEGWIDSVKYKMSQGLADFSLIPKYE